jgi:crotonobetainyl-CoA:carnitine CoA-transferase CaiB-like acyl-CoA transferase
MIAELPHPKLGTLRTLGVPVRLSDTPGSVRTPPPRQGEHAAEILVELLGLGDTAIAMLMATGAVVP